MLLNERKVKILEAIINDYIQTAEPIGSRTIAKKYDLGISSATVRNEMSDLEEMGYIIQPHASSGRVPSDKGYRFYVDRLMCHRELTGEEKEFLQAMVMSNISQIDYLMQETAKALAILTKYTTIVSEPKVKKTKIKHIQLVPLDDTSIIMVLVTENKVFKNHVIKLLKSPEYSLLTALSMELSNAFNGCEIEEVIKKVNGGFKLTVEGIDTESMILILKALIKALRAEDDVHVYTSGAKNILGFPEFSDLEKARGIFQALEEKEMLITLLGDDVTDNIQIIIGSENSLAEMKDCSIIKANYSLDQQMIGSIGILGPTRMNYPQVVATLNTIVKKINSVLQALTGG